MVSVAKQKTMVKDAKTAANNTVAIAGHMDIDRRDKLEKELRVPFLMPIIAGFSS